MLKFTDILKIKNAAESVGISPRMVKEAADSVGVDIKGIAKRQALKQLKTNIKKSRSPARSLVSSILKSPKFVRRKGSKAIKKIRRSLRYKEIKHQLSKGVTDPIEKSEQIDEKFENCKSTSKCEIVIEPDLQAHKIENKSSNLSDGDGELRRKKNKKQKSIFKKMKKLPGSAFKKVKNATRLFHNEEIIANLKEPLLLEDIDLSHDDCMTVQILEEEKSVFTQKKRHEKQIRRQGLFVSASEELVAPDQYNPKISILHRINEADLSSEENSEDIMRQIFRAKKTQCESSSAKLLHLFSPKKLLFSPQRIRRNRSKKNGSPWDKLSFLSPNQTARSRARTVSTDETPTKFTRRRSIKFNNCEEFDDSEQALPENYTMEEQKLLLKVDSIRHDLKDDINIILDRGGQLKEILRKSELAADNASLLYDTSQNVTMESGCLMGCFCAALAAIAGVITLLTVLL